MAVTYTSEGLTRPSGTITAQRPFFCVVLSGGGQWHVQAEWPDGTIEQIDAFKAHLEGVNWVRTQSEAWLREREKPNS
jgi:hypothetical protein